MIINISFPGRPADQTDVACQTIIKAYSGEVTDAGTIMVDPPVRDIRAEITDEKLAQGAVAALKALDGVTVETEED